MVLILLEDLGKKQNQCNLSNMAKLKANFKVQKTTIIELPDGTWLWQLGCPSYRYIFDTPQEMLLQYIKCLSDPQAFLEENKLTLGNKILKEVDLDVIINYLKQE